jgi:hypothetical protein
MPLMPALSRLKQEDCKFKTSMGCTARLWHPIPQEFWFQPLPLFSEDSSYSSLLISSPFELNSKTTDWASLGEISHAHERDTRKDVPTFLRLPVWQKAVPGSLTPGQAMGPETQNGGNKQMAEETQRGKKSTVTFSNTWGNTCLTKSLL